MADIVERLRARKEPTIEVDMHYPQIVDSDTPDAECLEAADEIERLRAALEWIAGTALTEPEAMVEKARAALEEKSDE